MVIVEMATVAYDWYASAEWLAQGGWPEDMAMGIPGSFGQGEFRFGRVGMEGQIIWRWGHGYPRKYRQAPGRQRHIWRPC